MSSVSPSQAITLITGGNRGVGLALATQLSARADTRVLVTCRTSSPELNALDVDVITGVEVRDPVNLSAQLKSRGVTQIKTLINNAGILRQDRLDTLDDADMTAQFEVNALGPLKVTHACLEFLGAESKVINISSRMGSVADNTSGGMYGYRMSKAALNIASVSLARDLEPRGVAVAILHPGFVRTGMTGGRGLIDSDEAARGLIARIDELTLENSGTFWHSNGETLPW